MLRIVQRWEKYEKKGTACPNGYAPECAVEWRWRDEKRLSLVGDDMLSFSKFGSGAAQDLDTSNEAVRKRQHHIHPACIAQSPVVLLRSSSSKTSLNRVG